MADTTTLLETTRTPIDGTEAVRLATTGANWKATLSAIAAYVLTGNSATATALATARAIYGNNFDGTAALTQIIASTFGGTGNGFTKFSGPTTSEKTFTLPNSSATLLYSGGALGTPSGGTLSSCDAFTGDSGSGGVKGIVPAPSAGDAAAGKFLKADGTFATPVNILVIDKGSVGTGTVTFSAAGSAKQKLTVTGNLTVAYSNWPASGTYGEVELQLVNGGSATVTWPTVSWLKGDGTNSTTFSTMGVTLYTSGTNFVTVWSTDGGTTLYGRAA